MRPVPRLTLILLVAAAPALRAQAPSPGAETLSERMEAFVEALAGYRQEAIASFFPRQGDWTWVLTTQDDGGADRVGRWRLRPDDVLPAIDRTGPLCESFSPGGDVMLVGTLMYQVITGPEGPWRRVRGNRFVPPGAPARSPVFVEWRREEGRWVLSAFGDTRQSAGPRLLGRLPLEVVRDTATAEGVYAPGRSWHDDNMPIYVDGHALIKYGLPRELARDEYVRYGHVDGVPVYREAGSRGMPEVLYAAVSPGMVQPYQNMTGDGCG